MLKQYHLACCFLCCASVLHATHNLSGEIIFKKTGDLSVEATIFTYTKASSVAVDRDSLKICWGDGTCQMVARANGNGVLIAPNIKKNTYIGVHTYQFEGVYVIGMTDPNRSAGILNVNPPSSENIPFHLEATLRLMPDASASKHSPVFLEPPVDAAYVEQPFVHAPNAFDVDGDSLAYELVTPLADSGTLVPNYALPSQIAPSGDNEIGFNPATGVLSWTSPQVAGHYCIAILVKAFRNGLLVETIHREILIEVMPDFNRPPAMALVPNLDSEAVLDVNVGQTIGITVSASEPDAGQTLTLSASGGPFENIFHQKAQFTSSAGTGVFTWKIEPEYLREQPYQIVFKAKDNFMGDGLATMRAVRFRVNALSGVEQTANSLEPMLIAPNPTPGKTELFWQTPLNAAGTLHLLDLQGNRLWSEPIPAGTNRKAMDLNALPSGLYFMEIRTNDGRSRKEKVIKT